MYQRHYRHGYGNIPYQQRWLNIDLSLLIVLLCEEQLVQHLRGLSKRDPTTRLKALQVAPYLHRIRRLMPVSYSCTLCTTLLLF
jgi:hypothetical protein